MAVAGMAYEAVPDMEEETIERTTTETQVTTTGVQTKYKLLTP